jgi:hypothetical protein
MCELFWTAEALRRAKRRTDREGTLLTFDAPPQAEEQGERRRVGPLEIIQHQQQWLLLRELGQYIGILLEDVTLLDSGAARGQFGLHIAGELAQHLAEGQEGVTDASMGIALPDSDGQVAVSILDPPGELDDQGRFARGVTTSGYSWIPPSVIRRASKKRSTSSALK